MDDPLRPVRLLIGRAGLVRVRRIFHLLLLSEVAAAAVVVRMKRTVDESVRLVSARGPALLNRSAIFLVDSAMR